MASPILAGASLAGPVDKLTEELDQIESIFARCKGDMTITAYRIPYIPTEDGCLVSMWDAWNRFLRALIMTSASGATIGLSGTTHTSALSRTEQDVLDHLAATRRSTGVRLVGGEPKWFEPTVLASVAGALGLSNDNVIISAITATSVQLGPVTVRNPLEEIRTCRNYVAHKGHSGIRAISAITGAPFVHLMQHTRSRRFGVETFSEWKEATLSLAEAAAQ